MTEPIVVPSPVATRATDRRRLYVLVAVAAVLALLLLVGPRVLGGGDPEPFEFPATPTTVAPAPPGGGGSDVPPSPAADSGRNPFVRG